MVIINSWWLDEIKNTNIIDDSNIVSLNQCYPLCWS